MNYTFLAAGIASVIGLWSQLKSIGQKFTALFVEKIEIDESIKTQMYRYLWLNFKAGKFRSKKFSSDWYYVKTTKRWTNIPAEVLGRGATFWKGWRPLFIGGAAKEAAAGSGATKDPNIFLSFIRGTFEIDSLLIDICKFDKQIEGVEPVTNHYRIVRHFGRDANDKNLAPESGSEQYGLSNYFKQNRIIGYDFDNLGMPVPKSPFEHLCYSKELWEYAKHIEEWKKSKEWYEEKGISWKTGSLFYGLPGTGKTSMARALAQHLNMPIHIFDLTTMSNMELIACWKKAKEDTPCIVLLEDLDRVFDKDKNVKGAELKCPLTMDGLLNCMSGIESSDGIVTIVTANDVSKLDPALGIPDADGKSTRPGRLDRALKFDVMDQDCRHRLASRILSDFPEQIEDTVQQGNNETGAQFSKRCEDLALKLFWEKKNKPEVVR